VGGRLTAPVVAGGRLYVASSDAHTLYALDAKTGERLWQVTAGGRIDSPPTIYRGLVLVGSADGRVTCLRATDGALVWRFLAAPLDRRIGYFGQVESTWPVHGSVLVTGGVAYVAAGRSTYLDGGIRLYGLDPLTGKVRHRGTLAGPWPDRKTWRDVGFYVRGARADVLVSEGQSIYMRQKVLTPALQEVKPAILSSKGEADVGLHVFSTAGLLDDSWYNRTFWMYSKRWPGFQLANQAPKSGQLLVVDGERTYGVKVFYRRNVHSPMFFPGKEGYLFCLPTAAPTSRRSSGRRAPASHWSGCPSPITPADGAMSAGPWTATPSARTRASATRGPNRPCGRSGSPSGSGPWSRPATFSLHRGLGQDRGRTRRTRTGAPARLRRPHRCRRPFVPLHRRWHGLLLGREAVAKGGSDEPATDAVRGSWNRRCGGGDGRMDRPGGCGRRLMRGGAPDPPGVPGTPITAPVGEFRGQDT